MPSTSASKVMEAVEAMRKAMISGDISELNKLAAEELIHGHVSGRTENKQEFIEGVTVGRSQFAEIELGNQTVTVIDDIALVHHVFKATRRKGSPGKPHVHMKVLAVWLFRQSQWQIVARQSARVSEENQ